MAASPQTATYQGFDEIFKQVQQLDGQPDSETIIRVASAFMQRPHVSPTYPQVSSARRPERR
jgi:DNA polymerase II small subunit/DNA polymerase delta subunit B